MERTRGCPDPSAYKSGPKWGARVQADLLDLMKEFGHLIVALFLAATTLSLLGITHTNENVKQLDFSRFYTLRWERAQVDAARLHLGISDRCQTVTNLSADPECLAQRVGTRDDILLHMQCNKYRSQTCAYLERALGALARTSTTVRVNPANASSPFSVVGVNLKLKPPRQADGKDLTFMELLEEVMIDAPKLFHGAYRAEQSDRTLVLRSALYNLITMAILGNLVVHLLDSYNISPYMRLWVRGLSFVVVFLTALVFLFIHTGNALVLSLILVTAFVSLVYFEMFLNETIVRPWIHPFTFAVIYQSTVVLSLVENGVLDYRIMVVTLLASMATAQLFMSIVWYYSGMHEKLRLTGVAHTLYKVYLTKDVQQALFLLMAVFLLMPLLQVVVAPFEYTYASPFLLFAPLVVVALGAFCTMFVEALMLGDEGQEDSEHRRYRIGNHGLPDATAITGGKLASSALLLVYGAAIVAIYLTEHIATFRSYLNAMPPPAAAAIDASRAFLLGPGLVAGSI